MSDSSGRNGGVGVVGLLGVVFVTLKLCGTIDWSWWWVTAPFWVPFAVAAVIVAIAVPIAVEQNRKIRVRRYR